MKNLFTEKNMVVVLFLLVVVVFSFAHTETKKIEYLYKTVSIHASSPVIAKFKVQHSLQAGTAVSSNFLK